MFSHYTDNRVYLDLVCTLGAFILTFVKRDKILGNAKAPAQTLTTFLLGILFLALPTVKISPVPEDWSVKIDTDFIFYKNHGFILIRYLRSLGYVFLSFSFATALVYLTNGIKGRMD